MEQTKAETEVTTYQIGGASYRLEPASFAQHEWLGEGPLKGIDFSSGITESDLEPIIQRHGPAILGIVLIADGMTREQKASAGLAEAQALGFRLKCLMTPAEVRAIAQDFFTIDGFQNMWFFIDFPALVARVAAERMATTSTPASVSLPMAIAPSAPASRSAADQEKPNSTSSGDSSADPSSAPSLVSAG